jgi:hypothetical protein
MEAFKNRGHIMSQEDTNIIESWEKELHKIEFAIDKKIYKIKLKNIGKCQKIKISIISRKK